MMILPKCCNKIEVLKENPLSQNDLAKALGYKGISAKLTAEVDRMLAEKLIVRVMDGNRVKLGIENMNYGCRE